MFSKRMKNGWMIVNEQGFPVHRDGTLAYHPETCGETEYPEYRPTPRTADVCQTCGAKWMPSMSSCSVCGTRR